MIESLVVISFVLAVICYVWQVFTGRELTRLRESLIETQKRHEDHLRYVAKILSEKSEK